MCSQIELGKPEMLNTQCCQFNENMYTQFSTILAEAGGG